MPGGGKRREFLPEFAVFVEQFVRPIALHPLFELLQMIGLLEIRDWNLMRSPRTLDRLAVDKFWTGPPLRCTKDDHRPARPLRRLRAASRSRGILDLPYLHQNCIERTGKRLMH